MLKKIQVKQLQIGMYVQELCGSWIETPFWKKSFAIDSQTDIEKILHSKIAEAIIDTDRGLDVDESASALTAPSAPATITTPNLNRAPTSIEDEMGAAANVVNKSREAVFSMFNEARMGKAVDVENVLPLVDEIASSVMRNSGALIGIARLKAKDDYTYMHSVAVCALMISLSKQLGLSEEQTREAGLAGLLHDIGKMAVSEDILSKPGKLTDAEFTSIKEHPAAGHRILLEAKGISEIALDVCLHHHEKIDGSGYPHGLSGDNISLFAKMGAVCDVYDAITSNRPYKQGWCPAESLRKMSEWSKGHFDDDIFQAFVRSVGIYPVGTLVKLESGRLGVVVEQKSGKALLTPKVRVFFSTKSLTYITPELLDLSAAGRQDKIVSREDAATWSLTEIDRFWLGDVTPPA
jgi:putative nucleotidyltransferase with HDIG domain